MFLARRPSASAIERFLRESQDLPLSYAPVGIAQAGADGWDVDEAGAIVGHGAADFACARAALLAWTQFDLGWVGSPTGNAHFGFAYGTLTNHAESGEELFEIVIDPSTRDVVYRLRATSRARAALARVGRPIVRGLQARFCRESVAAMTR
jgi:uncharacterized protein (UPF0548 family)